ncbi:amino acid permease [Clostridium estertheticum]|uniref:amino acid permease n=1 Tax=Clostridium estertheticum TaxID=238834 RepID=UPI001CF1C692|nr:amino acid permease [Clostridium estertheticum]MCB2307920.1 amino acid permease [Clostridium estertheticum]MCB2346044.1 amino acid permease [Clostridium estertheticum]MCB2351302.1 amino acid permease [Clostridium estertheticum]WAG44190.1 amino acid permease [Clostridium estertheticum]
MEEDNKKLGLGLLVALGIGTMIASGIFNSPTDLISTTNPMAVLISWGIGVFGVVMLGLVFYLLSNKKPELKGGIYSYAKEGYGDFVGFNSAWGYFTSSFLGNIAFVILIFKTINSLIGEGYSMPPILSFIFASILLWSYYFVIRRGIRQAGILNLVVTIGKVIPLILVIIFGFSAFKLGIFNVDNWQTVLASSGDSVNLGKQISGAMGTILWCFVGVEGLVVLSQRAESQILVGKGTIISLAITATLYVSISILSMGILPAKALVAAQTPLAAVLAQTALGSAGAMIVKVGILVSLIGALLCWLLLTTEILYVPADQDGLMPKWFKKNNSKNVPTNALLFSMLATQIGLFAMLSPALQKAYYVATHMCTTNILIPYLLSSMFAYKVYNKESGHIKEKIISIIACIYSVYVIYAVGIGYLGLAVVIYAVGIGFYLKAKKEKNEVITSKEKLAMLVIIIVAIIMIIAAAMGKISV